MRRNLYWVYGGIREYWNIIKINKHLIVYVLVWEEFVARNFRAGWNEKWICIFLLLGNSVFLDFYSLLESRQSLLKHFMSSSHFPFAQHHCFQNFFCIKLVWSVELLCSHNLKTLQTLKILIAFVDFIFDIPSSKKSKQSFRKEFIYVTILSWYLI